MARKKTTKWFTKVRGSYLPKSWQGWLSYVPFTAFLIVTAVVAFADQDSTITALYMIFPVWVAATVVMTWIASQKS